MQLIGGGMFAFSAFHALKDERALLLTSQVPLMLAKVVADTGDSLAVCWNVEQLWKRERMPGYRNRPEIWQAAGQRDFGLMLRVPSGLGVLQFRAPELEADEVLAALVHALDGSEPLLIRSDDKDFMQLLSDSTWMLRRVRGRVKADDVEGLMGMPPALIADLLALQGDAVDGIPRLASDERVLRLLRDFGAIGSWPETLAAKELGKHAGQLALNLALIDLGASAVGAEVPSPLADGYADRRAVAAIGEREGIARLASAESGFSDLFERGISATEALHGRGLF